MRLISLLLLFSLTVGCGSGSHVAGSDPRPGFGVTFPSITALTPSSSPVNSPAFTMTVQGTNFGTDAVVLWNGVTQQTTFINSTELLVTVTDTDLMFAGLTHVFVRSGGMNSNTVDFNVTVQ
jgi:IPT/TIG domain